MGGKGNRASSGSSIWNSTSHSVEFFKENSFSCVPSRWRKDLNWLKRNYWIILGVVREFPSGGLHVVLVLLNVAPPLHQFIKTFDCSPRKMWVTPLQLIIPWNEQWMQPPLLSTFSTNTDTNWIWSMKSVADACTACNSSFTKHAVKNATFWQRPDTTYELDE